MRELDEISQLNNSPERKKSLDKKEKLEQSWALLRECKDYIEKNSLIWEKRTKEETDRIKSEERIERLKIAEKKKDLKKKTNQLL